jgi:hypothetical protein
MSEQATIMPNLTADDFLTMDQSAFGSASRYELVAGRVVGRPALSSDLAAILAGLGSAIGSRLRGRRDCRPEIGSAAIPKRTQRNSARIPDAIVRCAGLPRILFEVVSPSELAHRRERDLKRRDLQDVEGVEEIVELYEEPAAHIYRRLGSAWTFEAIDGLDSTLVLRSVSLEIPLSEVYAFAGTPHGENAGQTG